MEIKDRKQALADGDTTYFTGKPCKNRHLNYRYVRSGACRDCIGAANLKFLNLETVVQNEDLQKLAQQRVDHSKARAQLTQLRLRVFDIDHEIMASAVWSTVAIRYPMLTLADVKVKVLPTDRTAGTGLYAYLCHPDDIEQLRVIANALVSAHSAAQQVAATREAAIKSAAEGGYVDTTPPENYK